mgnify:CR=1 FL=1
MLTIVLNHSSPPKYFSLQLKSINYAYFSPLFTNEVVFYYSCFYLIFFIKNSNEKEIKIAHSRTKTFKQ